MNQLAAMRETVEVAEQRLRDWTLDWGKIAKLDPTLQIDHLKDMLRKMEEGENPQKPGEGFSEAKMSRWLSWTQAACVAMGVFSLEDMKEINRRWSGGGDA